ncbi:TetR/AcrR family transcriptional regulator [Actinoplanes aureus]|uniref:TetR/AcrR family transcriptional regulator n=1 Tax=Actinoplanes aureus TaxID=2792083 RepID=A0A931G0P9_9ACTN|nr:TetR/AcrR family transcriptional regulator [Actinoplanes aureus]MBG0564286.1 TetR/AcrR family transcriptional regulator [Actinoplanes aureus]
MTGRPRTVSDDTVFRAVADTVTEAGPAGLTLAAVARRAGLTAPALTQRFGSKRGLLVAFATREAGSVADVFDAARTRAAGPLEALRDGLIAFTAPISTREGLANNLAFLQLDLTDEELHTHSAAQSRALRAQLVTLIEEAAAAGDIKVEDPAELADTVYAVYAGAQLTWAIDGSGDLGPWLAERIDRVLAPYR